MWVVPELVYICLPLPIINKCSQFIRENIVDTSPLPVILSVYLLLFHALMAGIRMVEFQNGKIEIDGMNIRNMGLDVLRGRLALVPQDSTLFLGTLRDNL